MEEKTVGEMAGGGKIKAHRIRHSFYFLFSASKLNSLWLDGGGAGRYTVSLQRLLLFFPVNFKSTRRGTPGIEHKPFISRPAIWQWPEWKTNTMWKCRLNHFAENFCWTLRTLTLTETIELLYSFGRYLRCALLRWLIIRWLLLAFSCQRILLIYLPGAGNRLNGHCVLCVWAHTMASE